VFGSTDDCCRSTKDVVEVEMDLGFITFHCAGYFCSVTNIRCSEGSGIRIAIILANSENSGCVRNVRQ
jgi:hypothetical protein